MLSPALLDTPTSIGRPTPSLGAAARRLAAAILADDDAPVQVAAARRPLDRARTVASLQLLLAARRAARADAVAAQSRWAARASISA